MTCIEQSLSKCCGNLEYNVISRGGTTLLCLSTRTAKTKKAPDRDTFKCHKTFQNLLEHIWNEAPSVWAQDLKTV